MMKTLSERRAELVGNLVLHFVGEIFVGVGHEVLFSSDPPDDMDILESLDGLDDAVMDAIRAARGLS